MLLGKGQLCFLVPDVCFSMWWEVCTFRAALARNAVYLTRFPLGKAPVGELLQ